MSHKVSQEPWFQSTLNNLTDKVNIINKKLNEVANRRCEQADIELESQIESEPNLVKYRI